MLSKKAIQLGLTLIFTTLLAGCYVADATPNAETGSFAMSTSDGNPEPGPVMPIPTNIWKPGVTLPSGTYLYLESDVGDTVGAGPKTYLYTPADATFYVTSKDGFLEVIVNGAENWHGQFITKDTLFVLQQGFYNGLLQYPNHIQTYGGQNWVGPGGMCATASGYLAIDSITYVGTTLNAIDLRFEQRCKGNTPALHGELHWRA